MINKLSEIKESIKTLSDSMEINDKISFFNDIKLYLHSISPFKEEPVDCVLWVNNNSIEANDYNPNKVAPPEMELLKLSILSDGYTQPIVTFKHDGKTEVIDGFHRNRVGKECEEVKNRVLGYLPVVTIKSDRESREDRIAATIRHNRARGKHLVSSMSEIVVELKRRNWSDHRISKELGMDEDEVLRLSQLSGLSELFSNQEFSEAWEAEIFSDEDATDLNFEEMAESE